MSEPNLTPLWRSVRAAEGKPANDPIWSTLLMLIGVAWQRYEIGDDDARALEDMVRMYRFPRR